MTGDGIRKIVHGNRYSDTTEARIQDALEVDFQKAAVPYVREYALSTGDRVDFLVDGQIAVEVKVAGSFAGVLRQIHRYAQHAIVRELVLMTTLSRHLRLPESMNQKPITVIHLSPLFGVVA